MVPEISIIVPVYKVEKYLDRCVRSILAQTFTDFELILVDDGSPDRCPQMCDAWAEEDGRIRVIHKANGGLSSARNAGLGIATGKYIGFVDSDDWIVSDMYSHLFGILTDFEVDIAICQYAKSERDLDNGGDKTDIKLLTGDAIWEYFYRIHGEPSNYAVWCRLYRKSVLDGVRFIDGRINEDVLFTYDAYQNAGKLAISSMRKYLYFDNPYGITRKKLSAADIALFEIWDMICQREQGENHESWARLNRERATFTLYTKGLFYGRDSTISKESLKEWRKELRHGWRRLAGSGILDFKRRVLLMAEILLPVR